jgi:hypothetical protein
MKAFELDNNGKPDDRYKDSLKNPAGQGALNQWIDINMKGPATNAVEMVSPDDPQLREC